MSARSRWVAVGIALLGACALAIAVQGAGWWSVEQGFSIGPSGTRVCVEGECSKKGLEWIGGTELWRRAGIATTAAGLITALLLVALAGALAARRTGRLAAGATLSAAATAAAAAILFVATFPGTESITGRAAGLGAGGLVHALGLLIAAAVSVWVLRRRPAVS